MAVKKAIRINHCVCPICQSSDSRPRAYPPPADQPADERDERPAAAALCRLRSRADMAGGISQVARITGLDRKTIRKRINGLLIYV